MLRELASAFAAARGRRRERKDRPRRPAPEEALLPKRVRLGRAQRGTPPRPGDPVQVLARRSAARFGVLVEKRLPKSLFTDTDVAVRPARLGLCFCTGLMVFVLATSQGCCP